ncbi:hypothetical protein B0H11DRAFT_1932105 [Mycena galericulata]|nr:hypothetical protein B0H11DRAFT_1932105 [Mycena galericulata]
MEGSLRARAVDSGSDNKIRHLLTLPVNVDAQDIPAWSTHSRAQNWGNIPFHAPLCARPAPALETHASPPDVSRQNVLGSTAARAQDWDHWFVDSSPADTDLFSVPPGFPLKTVESSAPWLDDTTDRCEIDLGSPGLRPPFVTCARGRPFPVSSGSPSDERLLAFHLLSPDSLSAIDFPYTGRGYTRGFVPAGEGGYGYGS